jgi:nitrite reductase/ring-hydroxylating ferredoxin subunit
MTTLVQDPAGLVRDDGVHRDIYRDPEIFALEMERIFKRTWVFMAHESEIASPGDYLTLRVGAEPVILVRSEDGAVRALVNRCRHRAAIVCEWDKGNAKSFRCHYHGWTYHNDGELTGVPKAERYDHDLRSELGLLQLPRVESYRGLIFASFNADVPSLVEHLGTGALSYIDRFLDQCVGLPVVAHPQAHRVDMLGNWKLQVENGLDGYHATFTHRSFFAVMQQRTGGNVRFASSLQTATSKSFPHGHAAIDPEKASVEPLLRRIRSLPDAERLLAGLRAGVGEDAFEDYLTALPGPGINIGIFPNLQLIGIHIRRIEPVTPSRTFVSVRPLMAPDAPAEFNRLRLRYHELFYGPAGFGQPDDFEMFSRVERGLDDTEDGWLRFDRGVTTESADADGFVGHVSDETPQRGQYRAWKSLMSVPAESR